MSDRARVPSLLQDVQDPSRECADFDDPFDGFTDVDGQHCRYASSRFVDPELIVPLPDKFDMEAPSADVPADIARFQGAWIGNLHDYRHILVVERVKADGHANVVFAQSDLAFDGMNWEWWRGEATIADGALTMKGFRFFRYNFDGPDRLYMTATLKNGGVTSGMLVRADPARLAAGDRPANWPWPGDHAWIPHLTVRTPDGARPIMLEGRSIRLAVPARHRWRSSPTATMSVASS